MRRPDPTETALDALRDAADLAPFLRHKSARVVMKAAEKALRPGLTLEVAPNLVEAFHRFLPEGAKRDPGCSAKLAIVNALIQMEDHAAAVFWAATRHTQLEAVWGGNVDTAAELRGIAAIGLVRIAHPEALLEAVRLLADAWPSARIGAIRALAESGKPEAELVLRFKASQGDKDPEVTGECFAALLRLGPRARSLPYVADFLQNAQTGTAEAAALALGESRLAEALPVLKEAYLRPGAQIQSSLILGISLLRTDEAIQFLLERTETDREQAAAACIEALAAYRHDAALRLHLEKILHTRQSAALRKAFETYWTGTT